MHVCPKFTSCRGSAVLPFAKCLYTHRLCAEAQAQIRQQLQRNSVIFSLLVHRVALCELERIKRARQARFDAQLAARRDGPSLAQRAQGNRS